MQLTDQQIQLFQETVWAYYHKNRRVMPWRETPTPYFVFVSELMLQQTQVNRVVPKFEQFVQTLPDFSALAAASLADVLRLWNGLGYNRRAKFLHQAAQIVVREHAGILPDNQQELARLPGIGPNTAGAILAYAYNQPVVFVETNIRTVYFYHFFAHADQINDKEVALAVAQTLDAENPREWYWALMDYGAFLKASHGNNIARSRHYTKQSAFIGSRRQIRGQIIKLLLEKPHTKAELLQELADDRTNEVIQDLVKEGLITGDAQFRLTDSVKLP